MILYARLDRTATDILGTALAGATVEIRLQGATVQGNQTKTTGQTVAVDEQGAFIATDQCRVYRGGTALVTDSAGGSLFTVSAVTTTTSPPTLTLTWASGGTLSLLDEDRISNISRTPTLYNDGQGNESTGSSTLTASATGQFTCWMGGGFIDRLTTSGASILLVQDDYVQSTPSGIRYVREARYGARGDGTTEDTTVIQRALDDLGEVRLPPGVYLTQTLYVNRGQVFGGLLDHTNAYTAPTPPTYTTVLKLKNSTNNSVIKSGNLRPGFTLGVDDANMHACFIDNLWIDGNKANQSAGHGIHFGGTGFTNGFRNLKITNCKQDGFHLGDSTLSPYVSAEVTKLDQIRVASCDGTGIYAEGTSGFVSLLIDSCKVDNCSTSALTITGLPATGTTVGRRNNAVRILNFRWELNSAGAAGDLQNGIVLDELAGAQVLILGAKCWMASSFAQRTGAAIKVTATSTGVVPNLMIVDSDQLNPNGTPMYASMYDDGTAAAANIADGPIAFFSNTTAGNVISNYFSRQFDVRTYSGDRGLVVQDWSETLPRFQFATQSGQYMLAMGSGSGAVDTNLYRKAANLLTTDDQWRQSSESLASANTITTATNMIALTGTGTIKTINPTSNMGGTELTLWQSDSGTTTIDETGNILVEGATITLGQNDVVKLFYDGAKWHQSTPVSNH